MVGDLCALVGISLAGFIYAKTNLGREPEIAGFRTAGAWIMDTYPERTTTHIDAAFNYIRQNHSRKTLAMWFGCMQLLTYTYTRTYLLATS